MKETVINIGISPKKEKVIAKQIKEDSVPDEVPIIIEEFKEEVT